MNEKLAQKRRGGRHPLPPEARKVAVPFRLYPPQIAAIEATLKPGETMQSWMEDAVSEKLASYAVAVIPSLLNP